MEMAHIFERSFPANQRLRWPERNLARLCVVTDGHFTEQLVSSVTFSREDSPVSTSRDSQSDSIRLFLGQLRLSYFLKQLHLGVAVFRQTLDSLVVLADTIAYRFQRRQQRFECDL